MRVLRLTFVLSLFSVSVLAAASPDAEIQAASLPALPTFGIEGDIPFKYQGKNFKTHFKLFGNILSPLRTPLIVLHGGPGLSYDYLAPFADLTSKYNIPVILYDQIGNARSSHYRNAPASFWNINLFIEELQNVINFFHIGKSFSLAGHSWGSVLASEFAVQRQPNGLKRLILSDGLASNALWGQSTFELLQEFPESVQQGMINGLVNPPAFEVALKAFYAVHGNRVVPPPKEYLQTLDFLFGPNGDPTVANATVIPNDWSIIDRIPLIKPSTLVLNGRYDISQDFVIAPFVEGIPKVKWVKFDNSSHMPFWEERTKYMQVVGDFLTN
ncbi:proline iminopeptidase [Panaeolus papilionaceus]|nr:proline iminopeptidase [Panaeolus papilionaceus]